MKTTNDTAANLTIGTKVRVNGRTYRVSALAIDGYELRGARGALKILSVHSDGGLALLSVGLYRARFQTVDAEDFSVIG